MDDPASSGRKTLLLGVTIGVLLSGIAALGAFLYFDGPSLVDSAFATNRSADRPRGGNDLCDRIEAFGDRELVHELGWYTNRFSSESVMMGRKTTGEICERATTLLRRSVSPAQFERVQTCVTSAATPAAVRACFAG